MWPKTLPTLIRSHTDDPALKVPAEKTKTCKLITSLIKPSHRVNLNFSSVMLCWFVLMSWECKAI